MEASEDDDRRPVDLAELLADAALATPERLALVEAAGRGRTWAELDSEVSRLTAGLAGAGILAGHRVLILLGNRIEFVTTYFAVLRAQAVAVPVDPRTPPEELVRMVADSGARLLVGDERTAPSARAALALLAAVRDGQPGVVEEELLARAASPRLLLVGEPPREGELAYDALASVEAAPVPPLPDPGKLAVLLYTAGTTGRPRAAMLSHRALLANLAQVSEVTPPMMHGDDVVLGVLPLFHVYGLGAVLGGAVRHRAKLVLQERFDPEGTLELIEDEGCSVLPVAPAVFAPWLAADDLAERLRSVRLVLSGSAPLSGQVVERFEQVAGIRVQQGYGLTEAAPVVTSTLRSAHPEPGSVGTTLPGVELRLTDDLGHPVEGGDPGEIWIRGENLFDGYWPDGSGGPGPDGWWATGDLGILDAAGDLYLVDKLTERIVVSGFAVYPHEVEQVLRAVDGVVEAAVIGVDDDETGQAVVAYVVAPDREAATVVEAVRRAADQGLARFKQPTRVEVVEALPVSTTGRVQKGRLRGIERRKALELLR